MTRIRIKRVVDMIATLESLERIDGKSESLKKSAIQYLELYADYLDDRGIKTIRIKEDL